MYFKERWKLPARPNQPMSVSFVEQGELIHIVYDEFLCTVSPDGTAVTRELDGLTNNDVSPAELAVLWGNDKLFVVTTPRAGVVNLSAYEIETDKLIEVEEVKKGLEGKIVIDAFRGPDGSVWFCAVENEFVGRRLVITSGSLRMLSAEGDLFELDVLGRIDWEANRSRWYPSSVITASDGTFWVAPACSGLIAYTDKDCTFTRYGTDDLSLEHISFIADGNDGTVYAATSDKVFAFRAAHGEAGAN